MQTSNRLFALVSALVLFTACQVPVAISEQAIQPTSVPTNPPEQQLHPTAVPPVASPSSTAYLPSLAASSSTPPASIWECAIDVHSHLDEVRALNTETTFLRSAENAIAIMDELGIQKELVMPPPFSNRTGGYEYALFSSVIVTYPDRFGFLGGGGTLNPILHGAVQAVRVTPEAEQRFEDQAREIVAAGAAGFGEIAALHLSFFEGHPFMEAPPDHPLLLLLTDIAVETGIPIELHMEAVPQDITLPKGLSTPPNAAILKANIAGLEKLLVHNPQAKIIWAHAGWDNTGFRTVDLMHNLLENHPNLYMSIKVAPRNDTAHNMPFDSSTGNVKPEWVDLFSQFPDRFVIGSDVFYGETDDPRATPFKKVKGAWRVVAGLPVDIAYQIACENPLMIYRIIP